MTGIPTAMPGAPVVHGIPQKGRDDGVVILRKQKPAVMGDNMVFSVQFLCFTQSLGPLIFRTA